MRRTVVVHSRYAWRCHRTKAATEGEQGLLIVTIEQLVARLAGGFLQFIDPDDLKTAVVAAVAEPLGEFEKIKTLPGFQRAAVTSLSKAWSAGLKLTEEAETAADETAKARISSLAMLEREVLSRLPDNCQRRSKLGPRRRSKKGPLVDAGYGVAGCPGSPLEGPALLRVAL